MSYDDNQNELPLPTGKNNKRTSLEHLPRYFRTPQNKKFLSSTLDQFTNPGAIEKVNGFVGKREAKAVTVLDNYIDDKILAKIIIGIEKLEDEVRERNPSKIRSILASVLDEYKPYPAKDHQSNLLNKDEKKANA